MRRQIKQLNHLAWCVGISSISKSMQGGAEERASRQVWGAGFGSRMEASDGVWDGEKYCQLVPPMRPRKKVGL